MAPFGTLLHPGTLVYFLVFLLIGLAFGAILEMSGFGDSRKLAAQFYFKDLTVLKVMFTGIVVAAVLIFLSSSLGLLNYDQLWVNPTYLKSEIVGGLIMGVGFIVGGFCPGTSLVAASTLKLDGILFVLGGFFGVWAFGESVGSFADFFNSSFYGRLTVFDWLGTSPGVVVLLLTLMALVMFYLAEIAEAHFGEPKKAVSWRPQSRPKMAAVASLLSVCILLLALGQPSPQAKWERLQGGLAKNLEDREVYVHPGEVAELKKNPSLSVKIMDVRSEADFNLFHIGGAQRLDPAEMAQPATLKRLLTAPDNAVFFLVSNGEPAATQAWKALKASGVTNLYIIEGGINKWLQVFPPEPCLLASSASTPSGPADQLQFDFRYAVGAQSRAAHPDSVRTQPWVACPEGGKAATATFAELSGSTKSPIPAYVKKVKLQRKVATKGGCG
ncbi:MAG: YeeE/YedE thiosulfate transporter family protein [Chloroflexi bacterium]|nr:YeeE/YedE thiosulfate transporter family protein [Deltaproteobacteria bacterium]MCX6036702.1 YeeE/YedE thiosulfate transporter family protein [Chloroflexota bacterium]